MVSAMLKFPQMLMYSTDFVRSDGSTIHIGDYETQKELQEAINRAMEDGELTQKEVNSIDYQ